MNTGYRSRRAFPALLAVLIAITAAVSGCGAGERSEMNEQNTMPAAIMDGQFCIADPDGAYHEVFLNGVNIYNDNR